MILLLCSPALANSKDDSIAAAKMHLGTFFKGDFKKLESSFAAKIVLMPGHELLKQQYGLAGPGGRKTATTVERAKVIAALTKATQGRPKMSDEQIKTMIQKLKFETLPAKEGDFAAAPADPVDTPDGKLHFTIKKGDVMIKVSPPRGDFLLYQSRKIDGKWKIVAEYLD